MGQKWVKGSMNSCKELSQKLKKQKTKRRVYFHKGLHILKPSVSFLLALFFRDKLPEIKALFKDILRPCDGSN